MKRIVTVLAVVALVAIGIVAFTTNLNAANEKKDSCPNTKECPASKCHHDMN